MSKQDRVNRGIIDALTSRTASGLGASDPFHTGGLTNSLGLATAKSGFEDALGGIHGARPAGTVGRASDALTSRTALTASGLGAFDPFTRAATTYVPSLPPGPSRESGPRTVAGAVAPRSSAAVPQQQQESASKVTRAADLGVVIRSARKALGLNQQSFADLAGVGRRFVSELESGKPSLEFDKVLRCCAAVGIDILAAPRRLA